MDVIGTCGSGGPVVVDRTGSHAATHLADDPGLEPLVREALLLVSPTPGPGWRVGEVDLGRIVGATDCVATGPDDPMEFVLRPTRDVPARFVVGRSAAPARHVSLVLRRSGGELSTWELWSAWVGRIAPPFPGEPNETAESHPFWQTLALVWGSATIVPGSETTPSPWNEPAVDPGWSAPNQGGPPSYPAAE